MLAALLKTWNYPITSRMPESAHATINITRNEQNIMNVKITYSSEKGKEPKLIWSDKMEVTL